MPFHTIGAWQSRSIDPSSAMENLRKATKDPVRIFFCGRLFFLEIRIDFIKFSSMEGLFWFIAAHLTKRIQNRQTSKLVLRSNGADLGIHKRNDKKDDPELP